jgi:hypothetical protein
MMVTVNQQDMKQAKPPRATTFAGETTCLPNKSPNQPHTLECAMGLKVDQFYYALQYKDDTAGAAPQGKVVVRGILTPGTNERYLSVGTILVEAISSR